MSTKSVQALQRAEDRQRVADLRHARRSRRAALAFEQRYALTYGMKGRFTNLRQMLEAMAQQTNLQFSPSLIAGSMPRRPSQQHRISTVMFSWRTR